MSPAGCCDGHRTATSLMEAAVVANRKARQLRGAQGNAAGRVLRFAAVLGLLVAWAALERKRRLEAEDAARASLPSPPNVSAPTAPAGSRARRRDRRRSPATRVASAIVFALVAVVVALTGALEGRASELTTTHSFAAVADAYINSTEPDANFGRESVLRMDSTNPNSSSRLADSYVRFDVAGLSGPVVSAAVRFYGTKGDNTGFEVRRVADSWSEESITWSNAPTADSEVIASSGEFDTGAWTALDVTSAVRDSGSVSLALISKGPAPMAVASREAGASVAPELVVTTMAFAPANEAPPSISGAAQEGATLTAALGTWIGAAPISYTYEWRRCDSGGDDCAPVAGDGTYTLSANDVHSTLRVAVTASNASGQSTATSAPTAVITPAASPSPGDSEPPSAPGNPTVTASAPTAVVLAWNASTDNVGVVGYGVYYDGTLVQSTAEPTAAIEGLVCGRTYEVSVDAVDAAGNRSQRTPAWVQTAACSDSEPPTAPTSLTLVASAPSSLAFSWSPSSDNVGVAAYHVLLDGVSVLDVTQPGATVQNLACDTTYLVAVEATDAAGNRSPNATISAATESCSPPPEPGPGDTTPPSQPGYLTVSATTAASMSLSWVASTDNVSVSGYTVYVDGAPVSSATQPGATVANLSCGTAYTFEVDAYDAAANRSSKASLVGSTAPCLDTQPPSAPANLVATSRTSTSIALSWSASTDNVGVTGYGLYRGGAQVGTSSSTTGIFSGLTCNTNYTLGVDSTDAAANRSLQTVVMVSTTACPDTTPPSTPTGLAGSNVSQTGLTLTWNASTDNVGVTGYDVYRNGTKMATVTSTSSSQTGLACGTSYAFAAAALDAAGNSSPQAQVNATTAACSPLPACSDANDNDADGKIDFPADPGCVSVSDTDETDAPAPPPGNAPPPIAGQGYSKVWGDEFSTLDPPSWGGIWWNPTAPANSIYVQNGILNLVSRRSQGYPDITLSTESSTSSGRWKQGYFEARMKWTKGPGAWPGFWLMGYAHSQGIDCPPLISELDVFEGQGTEPGTFYGTLHRNTNSGCGVPDETNDGWHNVGDMTTAFHTYSALWTLTEIKWYLDDVLVGTAPVYDSTNQEMFLLLQMWIGGWTSDPTSATPDELRTEVDWVHVWQKKTAVPS